MPVEEKYPQLQVLSKGFEILAFAVSIIYRY
jgi:hypothetical protein